MVQYDMPTNINGFTGLMFWANSVTGGYFTLFAIVSLYLVGLLSIRAVMPMRNAFIATGFFTAIMSMLFWTLGLLAFNNFMIVLLILGLATALGVWKGYETYY